MIHADDDDKFQYQIKDIISNFVLTKYFKDKAMSINSRKIFNFIVEYRPATLHELMEWVFQNGLYAEFRRGFAMYDALLREVMSHE